MPLSTAEQAIVNRFNAATSAVAARIQALIDNPPDDAAFDAELSSIAAGLEAMGSPAQPVPGPTP